MVPVANQLLRSLHNGFVTILHFLDPVATSHLFSSDERRARAKVDWNDEIGSLIVTEAKICTLGMNGEHMERS